MQEGKVVAEETLQISEERRDTKSKRKGKYTQLSAEFQGIARRGKKAFLNEQHKEIENISLLEILE